MNGDIKADQQLQYSSYFKSYYRDQGDRSVAKCPGLKFNPQCQKILLQ